MSKKKDSLANGPYNINKGPFFNLDLKLPAGKYLLGITAKATDKINKPKGNIVRFQDYIKGKWQYPKDKQSNSNNPASSLRWLLIHSGQYPKFGKNKKLRDKQLGELYLYCEERVGAPIYYGPGLVELLTGGKRDNG